MSHPTGVSLTASMTKSLGCDIEKLHKTVLSHHVFHPNELDALSNLPSGDIQNHEFLRLWTAKEAFLKAIGTGIDAKASSYDFSKSNTISLYDGSFWKLEHHTVCDFPDYLSCVCYKCLQ